MNEYICPSCKDSGKPCQTCDIVARNRIAPILNAMGDPIESQRQATETKRMITLLPCNTPEQYSFIGQALGQVKTQLKYWEDKRKRLTKPFLDTKREVDSWFKPILDAFKESERILKSKVSEYNRRAEQEQKAALASIEQAHAQQDTTALRAAASRLAPPPSLENVSKRRVWDWRLVDANVVPREYLTIDRDAVIRAIKSGARAIPGLEIYQREIIAVHS